jgi:hypothetical protein
MNIISPEAAWYLSQMWFNPWTYVILLMLALVFVGHRLTKAAVNKAYSTSAWILKHLHQQYQPEYLQKILQLREMEEVANSDLHWQTMLLQVSALPEHPLHLADSDHLVFLHANYSEFYSLYATRGLWMQHYIAQASGGLWVDLNRAARLADLHRAYYLYCNGSGMFSKRHSLQQADIPVDYLAVPFKKTKADAFV